MRRHSDGINLKVNASTGVIEGAGGGVAISRAYAVVNDFGALLSCGGVEVMHHGADRLRLVHQAVNGVKGIATDALGVVTKSGDTRFDQRLAGGKCAEGFHLERAVATGVIGVASHGAQGIGLQQLAVHRVVGQQRGSWQRENRFCSVIAWRRRRDQVLASGDRGLVAKTVVSERDAEAFSVSRCDGAIKHVKPALASQAVGVRFAHEVATVVVGVMGVDGKALMIHGARVHGAQDQAVAKVVAEFAGSRVRSAGSSSLKAQVARAVVLALDHVANAVLLGDQQVAAVVFERQCIGTLHRCAARCERAAGDACTHPIAKGVVIGQRDNLVAVGLGNQAVQMIVGVAQGPRVAAAFGDGLLRAIAEGVVHIAGRQCLGTARAYCLAKQAVVAVVDEGGLALVRSSGRIGAQREIADGIVGVALTGAIGKRLLDTAPRGVVVEGRGSRAWRIEGTNFPQQLPCGIELEPGHGSRTVGVAYKSVSGIKSVTGVALGGTSERVDLPRAVPPGVIAVTRFNPNRTGL